MTVDYGFLWWIAEPLFKFLNYFHSVTGNWDKHYFADAVGERCLVLGISEGLSIMANMRRVAPAMKGSRSATLMIGKSCHEK